MKQLHELDFKIYDYEEVVKEDILEWLEENNEALTTYNRDEISELLWVEDSVTGNGSGSYTFSSYKARCHLFGNEELLGDALEEFGVEYSSSAEDMDVTIRCYLLGQVLSELADEGISKTVTSFGDLIIKSYFDIEADELKEIETYVVPFIQDTNPMNGTHVTEGKELEFWWELENNVITITEIGGL